MMQPKRERGVWTETLDAEGLEARGRQGRVGSGSVSRLLFSTALGGAVSLAFGLGLGVASCVWAEGRENTGASRCLGLGPRLVHPQLSFRPEPQPAGFGIYIDPYGWQAS